MLHLSLPTTLTQYLQAEGFLYLISREERSIPYKQLPKMFFTSICALVLGSFSPICQGISWYNWSTSVAMKLFTTAHQ
jgi:hypothetical protein